MTDRDAPGAENREKPAIVLSISGHDPSGGAGVQADIEAIVAQGCHAASAITCLTVQDTIDVHRLEPVSADLLLAQAETVLNDLPVAVIKIGLIGSATNAAIIAEILAEWPRIPVVLDPVLSAGGGANLAGHRLVEVIWDQLLPRTTLITPNRAEARRLSGESNLTAATTALLERVGDALLLTGADESEGKLVENHLSRKDGSEQSFSWPKFAGDFHGSGCTLASACAARLALGEDLSIAVKRAQAYTWQTLGAAQALGGGQLLPRRVRC